MTTQTNTTNAPTLTATVGLPGSGKTTWARQQVAADTTGKTVRINRDDLRVMTFGKFVLDNPREQEPVITKIQQAMVTAALRAGQNVIVDDTNTNERFRNEWVRLAQRVGAKFQIKVMDTDVEECVRRDAERWERDGERLVGREVIERMAANFS